MIKVSRTGALVTILIGCLLFLPPFNGLAKLGIQRLNDVFDGRPTRSILFIGNSRTFYNDMPFMVREIADQDGFAEKLHIEMNAEPGVSLEYHLNNSQSQAQLARHWDDVVLQVLSSDQYSADQPGKTWEVAADLIRQIRTHGGKPAMFVTWRYTDQCTANAGMPQSAIGVSPAGYPAMHVNIQQQHAKLAALTGVDLVNVGILWEELQIQPKGFTLYADCNHPSIHGSYLSALMFYSYFSGRDVADVTFRPEGVSAADASLLRSAVSAYLKRKQAANASTLDGSSMP